MADKTGKTKTKRLPKGQRTHARRLKQAARKEISPQSSTAQPMRVQKKQEQS